MLIVSALSCEIGLVHCHGTLFFSWKTASSGRDVYSVFILGWEHRKPGLRMNEAYISMNDMNGGCKEDFHV